MGEKIEKVKKHLAENKTVYLMGSGCFVAGVVGTLVCGPTQIVLIDSVKLINWKSPHTSQNVIAMQRKGTLSNFVRDVTENHIHESQNDCAKALGVSPDRISKILNGKARQIDGHHLEKIGPS